VTQTYVCSWCSPTFGPRVEHAEGETCPKTGVVVGVEQDRSAWPLVDPNDDGIRPAGPPDACFYCGQQVGQPHGATCVIVEKVVRLRYTFEVDVKVPHHWTKADVEFHRNESSWCANNAVDEIEAQDGNCFCERFSAEFVEVLDDAPTRELRSDESKAGVDAMRELINAERPSEADVDDYVLGVFRRPKDS